MSINQEMEQSVKDLLKLTDSDLELELGRRLKINEAEVDAGVTDSLSAASAMSIDIDSAELAGPIDFLRNAARAFLNRFNQQMFSLICNPEDPDFEKVKGAIAGGAEKVAIVLTGILIAKFAWLPAIIVVIATLIAKRFAAGSHEAVCIAWKQEIED